MQSSAAQITAHSAITTKSSNRCGRPGRLRRSSSFSNRSRIVDPIRGPSRCWRHPCSTESGPHCNQYEMALYPPTLHSPCITTCQSRPIRLGPIFPILVPPFEIHDGGSSYQVTLRLFPQFGRGPASSLSEFKYARDIALRPSPGCNCSYIFSLKNSSSTSDIILPFTNLPITSFPWLVSPN